MGAPCGGEVTTPSSKEMMVVEIDFPNSSCVWQEVGRQAVLGGWRHSPVGDH